MKKTLSAIAITCTLIATSAQAWQRGDEGYFCTKRSAVQGLFEMGFGSSKDSCRILVLDVAGSNAKVLFKETCLFSDIADRGREAWIDTNKIWGYRCDK